MLLEALEVLRAWGFGYRSHCIWDKDRIGTGYWFRNKHEIYPVGAKGTVPAAAPGDQRVSIVAAAAGSHSEKPACFAQIIEATRRRHLVESRGAFCPDAIQQARRALFPSTPRVELPRSSTTPRVGRVGQ